MSATGRLVVISGPSGAGKTTLCSRLLAAAAVERVVTCTTRAPRPGETDGVDYHFIDRAEFERRRTAGELLEHAEVHDDFYGTPRKAVERGIEEGKTLLLNIDVQGARQVRQSGVEPLVTVFVTVRDLETLRRRLERRGTESARVIRSRLLAAREELEARSEFDHVITNENLERAVEDLRKCVVEPARSPPGG